MAGDREWRENGPAYEKLLRNYFPRAEAIIMTAKFGADRDHTSSIIRDIKDAKTAEEIHANLADRDRRYTL